jgi:hypothetical protein
MVSIVGAHNLKGVGAIHESPLQVRRNDKVAAQRRRWTFYETIVIRFLPPGFLP